MSLFSTEVFSQSEGRNFIRVAMSLFGMEAFSAETLFTHEQYYDKARDFLDNSNWLESMLWYISQHNVSNIYRQDGNIAV